MRFLEQYIVQFEEVFETTRKLGDYTININPMFDQPKYINRIGKVIETPLAIRTPIKKGYEVLVVHTVLLEEILPKQGHVENVFLVDAEKGLYQFDDNLIVMYREDPNKDWKCHLKSIMVEPISIGSDQRVSRGIELPDTVFENELGYKGNMLQQGVIAYGNPKLNEMGIFRGDTVMFKKDREYEFEIDGKTYWHMENDDILMHSLNLEKLEPEQSDVFT